MSNLRIYPYVNTATGWSISDSVMAAIWLQLEQEGKVEHLFYDGSIRDISGWLQHMKTPGTFPLVVVDMEQRKPVHVCWLKDIADGVAWAHHSSVGSYRRGAWETVVDYWSHADLRLLLGMTPETNHKAIKFLTKICKFSIVGKIPGICYMAYEDRRVAGVLSYYEMRQQGEIQWAARVAVA